MPTFTSTRDDSAIKVMPPLKTLAIGLYQSHHLNPDEIAHYFVDLPGVMHNYSLEKLRPITNEAIVQV